jgi:hypothetical protein
MGKSVVGEISPMAFINGALEVAREVVGLARDAVLKVDPEAEVP